ncbi:MAG: hypothetical protein ACXVPN_05285 [Bacteroidia bacterium]
MKKISILAFALVAISFASCKKDYTCTCTDATGGEVRKFSKVTKRAALAHCQTATTTRSGGGGPQTETCTLSK